MPNNTTSFLLQPSFNTSNFSRDTQNRTSDFYEVVLPVLIAIAILAPVAVLGNALVLAAIWRNPSLRTPSYILLAALAFTDLCTGIFAEPFFAANELILLADPLINLLDQNSWPTIYLITRTIGYGCQVYFFNLALFIITLMSIERWLHMTRRSWVTVHRLYRIVAVLFFLPIPFVFHIVKDPSNKAYYFTSISVILFCISVTSVAYFKVFRIIRRHQQQIHANESAQNSTQPAINLKKYNNSVFSIIYILVIFYIGYFPVAIAMGLMLFVLENWKMIIVSFYVSTVFVFLSSLLNPLLYLWRMKDIRNEVTKLVKQILCMEN